MSEPSPGPGLEFVPRQALVLALMTRVDGMLESAWLAGPEGIEPLPLLASDERPPDLIAPTHVHADAAVVGFVEGPGRALARSPAAAADSPALLARWISGAAAMLRLRHARPHSTVLVDISDVERDGPAVRAHLESRLGAGSAVSAIEQAAASDPIADWLGATVASTHPEVARLWAELQVSCEPIDAKPPDASPLHPAAVALRHHLRRVDEQGAVSQRLRHIEAELLSTKAELKRANNAVAAAEAARTELQDALELEQLRTLQAIEELDILEARARQVQEMQAIEELDILEARARQVQEMAQRAFPVDEARRQVSVQDAALQEMQAALEQARGTQQQTLGQLQRTQDECAALRQDAGALQHELVRLCSAQWSIAGRAAVSPPALHELTFVVSRDHPPHRELVIALHDVQAPTGLLAQTQMRLIEHEGRAGLAFFADGDRRALAHWQPDGVESGRAFMLIIPDDDAHAVRLARLGTADWRFVLGLTQRVRSELAAAVGGMREPWYAVASRLHLALRNLTPRWRYSALAAAPRKDPSTEIVLDATFVDACFGIEPLGDVHIRWRRTSDGPALEWLLPADAASAPLACWPRDDAGTWREAMPIPIGAGASADDKARFWSKLPPGEGDLLLGLLDALPAVAALPGVRDAVPLLTERSLAALLPEARRRLLHRRLSGALRRALNGRRTRRLQDRST